MTSGLRILFIKTSPYGTIQSCGDGGCIENGTPPAAAIGIRFGADARLLITPWRGPLYEFAYLILSAMTQTHSHAIYLKTMYFVLFIGLGCAMPFSSLFLKRIIVDENGVPVIRLIGIILSALPFVGLAGNLTSATIADRLRVGRKIIAINCFAASIVALLLAQCAEPWTAGWGLGALFAVIFILMAVSNFMTTPLTGLMDAETLHHLADHGGRARYGTFRLWGTFGWSVSTISIGFIMTRANSLSMIYYGAAFGYILLGVIAFRSVSRMSIKPMKTISLRHLAGNRRFQMYLLLMFIYGTVYNASFTYVAYFFDDVMKSFWQMGLVFGTWTAFEIPVMIWSRRLVQRFGSRRLIVFGLLCIIARLFLFSLFTRQTPFVLKFAAALLHGPAYGFVQIGSIDFIDRHAHESLRATYLGTVNMVQTTFGTVAGALLGGWIIGAWNSSVLFSSCGWVMAATTSALLIFVRISDKRKVGVSISV
jgi:PPP family 3-phenylpropionic acid transporter